MIKILENIDTQIYNNLAVHPLGLFEWGEARKSLGTPIVRFGEYDENSNLVNTFQMSLHKIPMTSSFVGYIPRSKMPNDEFLDFLKNYAKENKIVFVKFEPVGHFGQDFVSKSLIRSQSPIFYNTTRIIDATLPEEELKAKLEKKTRYNINLATKNGVTISEDNTKEGFEESMKLFFKVAQKKKYGGHTYNYHKMIWDNLSKVGVAKIFLAKYKGQTLASYEVFVWKDTLYTPYSGTSPEFKNVKAKNLLLWEVILAGKKYGVKNIDLWGTLREDDNGKKSWQGFSDFKKGYGGKLVETAGSFDLVINPTMYRVFNFLNKTRSFVRSIFRL